MMILITMIVILFNNSNLRQFRSVIDCQKKRGTLNSDSIRILRSIYNLPIKINKISHSANVATKALEKKQTYTGEKTAQQFIKKHNVHDQKETVKTAFHTKKNLQKKPSLSSGNRDTLKPEIITTLVTLKQNKLFKEYKLEKMLTHKILCC